MDEKQFQKWLSVLKSEVPDLFDALSSIRAKNDCIAGILPKLAEPFPAKYIQWRAGSTNRDKTRAMALAYVDPRHYTARMNKVFPGWESDIVYFPAGKEVVEYDEDWKHFVVEQYAARVRVCVTICGVTRCDVGEEPPGDNALTTAVAQGMKRAFTQFGLGMYLYFLGRDWVGYDAQKKRLTEYPVLPKWAVPEGDPYIEKYIERGIRHIPAK